jgi:hypothetical protein
MKRKWKWIAGAAVAVALGIGIVLAASRPPFRFLDPFDRVSSGVEEGRPYNEYRAQANSLDVYIAARAELAPIRGWSAPSFGPDYSFERDFAPEYGFVEVHSLPYKEPRDPEDLTTVSVRVYDPPSMLNQIIAYFRNLGGSP